MFKTSAFKSSIKLIILLVLASCVTQILGYAFSIHVLKIPLFGYNNINPISSICILAVASCYFLLPYKHQTIWRTVILVCLTAVCLISTIRLLHIFFPATMPEIDLLLFPEAALGQESFSARMSSSTAICFMLINAALGLLLWTDVKQIKTIQVLLIGTVLITYFSLIGYLFNVPEFFSAMPFLPMSFATAILTMPTAIAFLSVHPHAGFLKEFDRKLVGGRLASSLLPFLFITPILIGYIRLVAQAWLGFSTELGIASLVSSISLLALIQLYITIRSLNKRDLIRLNLEQEIVQKNQQVEEQSQQVHATNIKLLEANKEIQASNEEAQATLEELLASNESLNSVNEKLEAVNIQLQEAQQTIHQQASELVNSKERERALSEANLTAILDTTDHGYILLDEHYVVRSFNRAYHDLIKRNVKISLSIGSNIMSIVEPDREELFRNALKEVRSGKKVQYERPMIFDNKTHWIMISISPVIAVEKFEGYCIAMIDQTALKQAQLETQEERNLLRVLIDHLPINIYVKDLQSRKILANKAEYEYLGFSSETEVLGKSDWDLFPTESATISIAEDQSVFEGEIIINRETLNEKKDGQHRAFLVSKVPLRNASGEINGLVGISIDISERKQNESAIRVSNERYEAVALATNDAIWDWDLHREYVDWNHGLERIFNYSNTPQTHQVDFLLSKVHPDDLHILSDLDNLFKNIQTHWAASYRFMDGHGVYRYIFNRAYILYDNKKAIRVIGAMQDITEIMQYRLHLEELVAQRTKELEAALLKEKEIVEMRSRFVTMASHEFRTPLTTISMLVDYIHRYRDKLNAAQIDERMNIIQRQITHMVNLLDDVLMVGKAETGKITPQFGFIPSSWFAEIVQELIFARQHPIKLKTGVLPDRFYTDEKLLRNIVGNLLVNAIKFSPAHEEVVLDVQFVIDCWVIRVKDHGPGIFPEDQQKIFEPFFRSKHTETIQGTGLGLSIVKNAVDLLQGEIMVETVPGAGSEFIVKLPVLSVEVLNGY